MVKIRLLLSRSNKDLQKKSDTLLDAAALQDHFVRSLNLSLCSFKNATPSSKKLASLSSIKHNQEVPVSTKKLNKDVLSMKHNKDVLLERQQQSSGKILYGQQPYRMIWVCEECTLENCSTSKFCDACKSCRYIPSSSLSLAQKRGLVEKPPPKLSKEEWNHVEERAEGRGESLSPCSICREPLGTSPQVILSCSHIFHQVCLASFERFLRTSQRTCPLCRKKDYQKRITTQGTKVHRVISVIKIQSLYRGYRDRKIYYEMLQNYYKNGYGDPDRRKLFYAQKIGKMSNQLVVALNARANSVDCLLEEVEKSMAFSRQVFAESNEKDEIELWNLAFSKCLERNDTECPICIILFSETLKEKVLLSCSHVFHSKCLHAFEDFNISDIHLCPVCRSQYKTRSMLDFNA